MALYQRGKWLSYRAQMALSLRADGSGLPRFVPVDAFERMSRTHREIIEELRYLCETLYIK